MEKRMFVDVLHEYLDSYAGKIKSIILGCTHYPILENQIKDILQNVEIFPAVMLFVKCSRCFS